MYMVGHQVPFFDTALSVPSRLVENLSEMLSQLLPIHRPASAFRDENHMIFTLPLGMA